MKTLEFISSNGNLIVNQDGTIHESSELSDWLLTIKKVDLEELSNYYNFHLGSDELLDSGDVFDFCYWDKDDNYHQFDENWRLETFRPHYYNLSENERRVKYLKGVVNSLEWIIENRY